MKKFYVSTPIYYVNDVPHVGHAYTTLAADVISRYYRLKLGNKNVFFLTGTDEHGANVLQAAKKNGMDPKKYADSVAPRFREAWELLNIKYDFFIRTTDPEHERIAAQILQRIYDKGYIYEGTYEGWYCIGCERFLASTDIIDGKCPLHPTREPQHQKEKNYFLKLKELSKIILKKIEKMEYRILPEKRHNEIVSRLKAGVDDISVSRAGVSWGIPVPWDKSQTIYVWVEALLNYYTATKSVPGKGKFWPADLHLMAKDILWFHSVIWQGILIAAGLPLPKTIFAHGFFTIDGQKMSKSLGNIISPKQLVDKYTVDGARYLLLTAYEFGNDGDLSISKFTEKYNADLANGIGNTVARVAKLAENSGLKFEIKKIKEIYRDDQKNRMEEYRLDEVINNIWKFNLHPIDRHLDLNKPWLIKDKEKLHKILQYEINEIRKLALLIKPFMPDTSDKITGQFKDAKIKFRQSLFPRLK